MHYYNYCFYFSLFLFFTSILATRTDLIGVKIRATLVAYQLWYIFCEKCRERALKATAEQRKNEGESEPSSDRATPDLDHHAMRDNAVFLLDLAPLINSGKNLLVIILFLLNQQPHYSGLLNLTIYMTLKCIALYSFF